MRGVTSVFVSGNLWTVTDRGMDYMTCQIFGTIGKIGLIETYKQLVQACKDARKWGNQDDKFRILACRQSCLF